MIRYSNKELELIAENELNKCEEEYFIRDGVINIELFIEKHFKLELEYKKLVTDQIAILFVEGFSTCVLPEDDDDFDEEINIIIINPRTIVINTKYDLNENEGRLRFTMAHEVSHWILHRKYTNNYIDENNLKDLIEREADLLAAELLMPKKKFLNKINEFTNLDIRFLGFNDRKDLISKLAEYFKVSKKAASIRLEYVMGEKTKIKSTQECVQSEGEVKKIEKADPVNKKTAINQQLSFEISNDFLKSEYVYEHYVNPKLKGIFELICKVARENGVDNWKIENGILNIPDRMCQLKPFYFTFFDIEKSKFYSLEKLDNGEIIQINLKFKEQIENFIENNKKIFEGINLNLENICYCNEESKKVNLDDIISTENVETYKKLINFKVIKNLLSKDLEYNLKTDESKHIKLKFNLCYNVTSGIEAMSEIINIDGKRFAWVIQPNIVRYEEKYYFEPKIVFRRMVSSLIEDGNIGAQFRDDGNIKRNLNRTIFIKAKNKYITARICKNKDDDGELFKGYYKDYFIFKELKQDLDIDLKTITNALIDGEGRDKIFIAYHSSMDENKKTNMGAGFPGNDKIAIKDHILNTCRNMPVLEGKPCTFVDNKKISKINGPAVNDGKFYPHKSIGKFIYNEINLYVFRSENFQINLFENVKLFFENPSEIKHKNDNENNFEKIGVKKLEENKYLIKLYNKEIILNILDVINEKIVRRKTSEVETYELRKNLIEEEIKEFRENSIAIIQIEDLRGNLKFDSKSIIRKAFNSLGVLNQFITGYVSDREPNEKSENEYLVKTHAAILDMLNDIGITNGYNSLKDKVIYSFWDYKIVSKKDTTKHIPFLIRSDENTIEFMCLEGNDDTGLYEWYHISKVNKVLYHLSVWIKSSSDICRCKESEIIEEIIEEINRDKREKVVILSHKNNFDNNKFRELFMKITNASVVETSISSTELVQIHKEKGHTGITTCIYKLNDKHYRSNGEKMQGMKVNSSLHKIDKLNFEYKYRNLMDIKIIKSNMDNDILAEVIHRLRTPLTTKIHINQDMLTEHLNSFEKHLK
ncbi:ImmA/IrrE family metallo-endopeptidase [Clostridium perfringens]|nr:ImmA/IrrE family metallo-endopeptidase [Clostridium perfringens]